MIKNWLAVITLISVAFFMISSRQNVPVTTLEKRAANSNGFVSSGNVNVQSENLNGGRTERMDTKVPENGSSKVDKINGTLYYKEGKTGLVYSVGSMILWRVEGGGGGSKFSGKSLK